MWAAALSLAGCVLQVPADNYPFSPQLSFDDEPDAGNSNNVGIDDGVPFEPPLLLFTELLIDAPGEDATPSPASCQAD